MTTGRPSKYKPEYCEEIIKFFDQPATRLLKKTYTTKQGTVVEEEIEVPNKLPTLEGFANHLGISRDTLLNWTKDHPEFEAAYTRAKLFEQEILVENGLKGLYNPNFAVFVATNFTKLRNTQEIEVDADLTIEVVQYGSGGKPKQIKGKEIKEDHKLITLPNKKDNPE